METVIIKSITFCLEGVVDYSVSSDEIKVSYNVKCNSPGAMIKLLLLSSLKPLNKPVAADTLEFGAKTASGQRRFASSHLALSGYRPLDIDTFVFAEKTPHGYVERGTAFSRLYWDTAEAIGTADDIVKDASLKNADCLLNSLKRLPAPEIRTAFVQKINLLKTNLKKSSFIPNKKFEWYELDLPEAPVDASAFFHLLTPSAKAIIQKSGFPLMFGVGEGGMTALAVRKPEKNPFENAEDCTAVANGFYVVGVLFGDDGQYFVRVE